LYEFRKNDPAIYYKEYCNSSKIKKINLKFYIIEELAIIEPPTIPMNFNNKERKKELEKLK